MVISRAQSQLAFDHVMNAVLGKADDSMLKRALLQEGVNDMFALLTLDKEFIMELVLRDEDGEENSIPRGDRNLLQVFLDFVRYRDSAEEQITDWISLTAAEFDSFRISPEFRSSTGFPIPVMTKPPTAAQTSSAAYYTKTPAEMFKRGIKRDITAFPSLKDERYNDNWHRSFFTQACAQDVGDVLDPSYKPQDQEQKDLFTEKQKYVYAVLEKTVLTDRGKEIIRQHEHDFDAQSVYKKLKEHHLHSTKAAIGSSTLLTYITSAKLGSGTWKGTTEGFIRHWREQVRLYERQKPVSDHFSDGLKRTMLENAVHPLPELRQIKINADLARTNTGQDLTYEQYYDLLSAAATNYDESKQPASVTRARRTVYMNEIDDIPETDDNSIYEDAYDIDMPLSVLEAYAHERPNIRSSSNPVRMPRERWMRLSDDARKTWDQLDDRDKSIILSDNLSSSSSRTRRPQRPTTSHVNLHDISAHQLLQAFVNETSTTVSDEPEEQADSTPDEQVSDESDTNILVNAAKTSTPLPPGDIRRVLSTASKRKSDNPTLSAKMHCILYRVSNHVSKPLKHSLIDRGANGGVAGADVRIINKINRQVDIEGIDNHQMTNIDIGTVGGVVTTQKGSAILIMHQYALYGKGTSIHSPAQFEWFKNTVDDKSIKVGGKQSIKTPDGYVIPLNIVNGLARVEMRPFTDYEWESLPHIIMTNEATWDPSVLDHTFNLDEEWHDALSELEDDPKANVFDEFGNYRYRVAVHAAEYLRGPDEFFDTLECTVDRCVLDVHSQETQPTSTIESKSKPITTSKAPPDYGRLRPLFGWLPIDIVKKTLELTTQYARLPAGSLLKRAYKSSNPAFNVPRRSEDVASDFIYSDEPAVDNGSTGAVVFVGRDTLVTDAYGVHNDREFVNTLEDNIRERGAPTGLISDRAQVEISQKVQQVLRTLFISSWQSEPYQQNQNYAERRIQTLKNIVNRILDRTGAPIYTWLLCLTYVCFLLNHTYSSAIQGVPLQRLHGSTVDVSPLLRFHFYQKVYYLREGSTFPDESKEGVGYVVGISEHVGPIMTYKVLTADTNKVIYRSQLRPFSVEDPNRRAEFTAGENSPDPPEFVKLRRNIPKGLETSDLDSDLKDEPLVHVEELIGRSFLMDKQDDGQRLRATISKCVEDHESDVEENPARIKFVCSVGKDKAEEIFTYAQIMDFINQDDYTSEGIVWKSKRIVSHQGPLKPGDTHYMGSKYNVMIEWECGETTREPLSMIAADDPVTCAIYARDNNLLELDGWKRFKRIARREKKLLRLANQAKLRSYRRTPKYQYGYMVALDYEHAMKLDSQNGNNRWKEAIELEMKTIDEYETFEDFGDVSKVSPPDGYKKIRVHLVFAVKHDGRHKARLVADGHLTEVPLESVYSGVVSLRSFRIVLFLAELNGMETWSTDVGSAYLEAKTSEKVYIIAGPEFGERAGHILIIKRALYGLRSSGARWHDRFSDCLREMGFIPSKAEPDVWLRPNKEKSRYEYVAVYVDDLALVLDDPEAFINTLLEKYKFKLKGTGPIKFHLGMDFFRDEEGYLCIAPRKYIEKIIANYERLFGESPRQTVHSPLEKGDHPEIDTSDLLNDDDIQKYQSLIGSLQWVVTIGRFDITTSVMTLSSFRAAPRKGHLDRVKRIYGYLSKMRHAAIRIRTEEPDYSDVPDPQYDWKYSVYGNVKEIVPKGAPEPLGKFVTLSHYVDANLMHDMVTGRAVTGILHLLNKTPIDWYSKKQATVETATYGSEFCAARTCVEQIIELRNCLRYLGVPIREKSYMFGDNKSVVDSSMQVHSKLHKRHNILSYHRVREAIASGTLLFTFIRGDTNPADLMSKHWGYSDVWAQLRALLFWTGDTHNT